MSSVVSLRFIQCHDYLKKNNLVRSSRQFATSLDYAPQSLNEILKQKRDVTIELCRKAICKYKINAHYLFCGKGDMFLDENRLDKPILTVVTDRENNEQIVHVPIAAQAGYGGNVTDVSYFEELPSFNLPNFRHRGGTHRCFDISGESMEPTMYSGDQVVCSFVDPQDWKRNLKEHNIYVVVSHNDVVVKRINNHIETEGYIELISDNEDYQPYTLQAEEIVEIWLVRTKISAVLPAKHSARQSVSQDLDQLKDTLASQSAMIQSLNATIESLLRQNRTVR